jgi:citrate lyase subunit beta/citryl-CoA lyase
MKLRRTMLYIPGNNPGMMIDGDIYGADSIMLDLEDSVSQHEKDAARLLVFHMLSENPYACETVVRINGLDTPFGGKDIDMMVKAKVDVIRLPKTDSKEDIEAVENLIEIAEKKYGHDVGSTKMMAAIESPLGIINAYEIATASKRLIGIALGAEDFVTNMKTKRTKMGIELLTARGQLVMAARAAGIYALDTVFSNINDMAGFRQETSLIKNLGFDGKSVINPIQIEEVHKIFQPTQAEIAEAKAVMMAIKEAESKGSGVIALNGKMIDKPIVERAERVLKLIDKGGLYE